MVSRKGFVKKTKLKAFSNPRTTGIIACRVDEDDQLLKVELTTGEDQILLSSQDGKALRFEESQVRDMGRNARGVRGIRLKKDDRVVSLCVAASPDVDILTVTENGYGKRTALSEYRLQQRAGQGVINIITSSRNGKVVGSCLVNGGEDLILITANGKLIRLPASQIRKTARNAQGVKLIDLDEEDRVADLTLVSAEDEVEVDEVEE
jgi:DNA gyrase subunit A